jgi:hypothetical protein
MNKDIGCLFNAHNFKITLRLYAGFQTGCGVNNSYRAEMVLHTATVAEFYELLKFIFILFCFDLPFAC